MINNTKAVEALYKVVVNQQGQYSIYLKYKELPVGWEECGYEGQKKQCLSYIGSVWVDMRPVSVRNQMTA
jgi:MbtH protein